MSLEHLTLDIKFYIKCGKFETGGNVSEEGREELVATFLRGQMGAGEDYSNPEKRDVYHIQLKWYPEDDTIAVKSDTGNKGLRDGILLHYLQTLE